MSRRSAARKSLLLFESDFWLLPEAWHKRKRWVLVPSAAKLVGLGGEKFEKTACNVFIISLRTALSAPLVGGNRQDKIV